MASIGCFSSAQIPLLPITPTTPTPCRASVSNSIPANPNAPSPSSSTTCRSGCASLAARAYPERGPALPLGMRDLAREPVPGPGAGAAVGPWVEPAARLVGVDDPPGERDE